MRGFEEMDNYFTRKFNSSILFCSKSLERNEEVSNQELDELHHLLEYEYDNGENNIGEFPFF